MLSKFIDDFEVNMKRWVFGMAFTLVLEIFSWFMFFNIEGIWRYYFLYIGCFILALVLLIRGQPINYTYYWIKEPKRNIRKYMLVPITHEYIPARLYYFYIILYSQLIPSTFIFIILIQVFSLSSNIMLIFTISFIGVVLLIPTITHIYFEIKEGSIYRKEKEKYHDILRQSKGKEVSLKHKDYNNSYYIVEGILLSFSPLNTEVESNGELKVILSSQIIDVKVL